MSLPKRQPEIFSDATIFEQINKLNERLREVIGYMNKNPKEQNVRVYMTQWLQNLNGLPRP